LPLIASDCHPAILSSLTDPSYILRKVLDEYLVAWAPLVRQAAAAWLYSMLQYKGECMLMATDCH
jgi:hypothetical protein